MIQTPRLIIRPFQEQDCDSLFEYLSDPGIYKYEPSEPITLDEARKLTLERSRSMIFWAVELRDTQKMVGHLYFQQTEPQEFLTWELGYIFNPRYQNKGYATESAAALIRYGFDHWGIHRVMAHCNPENIASWRVLEKIGMQREGYFRSNAFFKTLADGWRVWVDTFEYAILKQDIN